jgi:hypothetical protein
MLFNIRLLRSITMQTIPRVCKSHRSLSITYAYNQELIEPAVNGTVGILKSAVKNAYVSRFRLRYEPIRFSDRKSSASPFSPHALPSCGTLLLTHSFSPKMIGMTKQSRRAKDWGGTPLRGKNIKLQKLSLRRVRTHHPSSMVYQP